MYCYVATDGELQQKSKGNGLYALLDGEKDVYEF